MHSLYKPDPFSVLLMNFCINMVNVYLINYPVIMIFIWRRNLYFMFYSTLWWARSQSNHKIWKSFSWIFKATHNEFQFSQSVMVGCTINNKIIYLQLLSFLSFKYFFNSLLQFVNWFQISMWRQTTQNREPTSKCGTTSPTPLNGWLAHKPILTFAMRTIKIKIYAWV